MNLLRRWWPVAAGVAGLALAIALGFWFVDARKGWTGEEASQAYQRGLEALQAQNESAAEAAFVEAEGAGNPAYEALALMQRGGLRAARGETAEAVALYDQAAEAANDPMIEDGARLKAAWTLMNTGSIEDLTARLSPLTEDGRPFRYQAREALALAHLQHGQTEAAQQLLQALLLQLDVPEGLRQRAQIASNMIESGSASAVPAIIEAAGRAAEADEAAASAPGAGGSGPQASAAPPAGQ